MLYLIYCAEAGLYLLLVPWSMFWGRVVLSWSGTLRALLLSGVARGAISALGALMLTVGTIDLIRFCRTTRAT
jgi:hypothetical protein